MELNDRLPLGERVAKLETRFDQWEITQNDISQKLDGLLDLKLKGMGALWFVWIIVGSGILGLVTTVLGLFHGQGPRL